MDERSGGNRSVRILTGAVALVATFYSTTAFCAPADKNVVVTNVPLPVAATGTVDVSSLPPVSLTVPAHPFSGELTLLNTGDKKAVGVTGSRLAVTTLTISNFDTNPQQLFLFNPVISGNDCSGTVTGGATPFANVIIEPRKTLQLQYPTPMVFSLSGLGCIAGEVTTALSGGSVVVDVVGFATP